MNRLAWLRIVAYLIVVAAGSWGLWRVQDTQDDLHDLVQAEAREDDLEEAERCVSAWTARRDIRDMAETGYRRNAETLLSFASGADPERIAAYRSQVDVDVREIRSTLPDPSCDLEAAQRRLADQ